MPPCLSIVRLCAVFSVLSLSVRIVSVADAETPNIVLILADDMGYGDPTCYNRDSKCVTPNIDQLAAGGMRFTDAHSAGSVCVPSRYGLMTGQYPFRNKTNQRAHSIIDSKQLTVPGLLQQQGYQTAMVGKWHLGFDGGPDYDYSQPLKGGPIDRGFATFFGMHASLDIPPYFFIRQDRAVEAPTETIEDHFSEGWTKIQGAFWRGGLIAPDFKHDEILDRFAAEAATKLNQLGKQETPFFLYVALPAPHTPWLPAEQFRGIGGAGMYGEYVAQVDDVVGRILRSLDETGKADQTLVIFSSDNGPVWYETDRERLGHSSVGPLRGMKGDSWEGGHRVPFLVRWPEKISAGTTCDHLIGFVDVLATLADLVDVELPSEAGPDSTSFLGSLTGSAAKSPRKSLVLHHQGTTLRKGPWKLIDHLGSGGFSEPKTEAQTPDGPRGQLYHLGRDLGETTNLWKEHPERVQEMSRELKAIHGR